MKQLRCKNCNKLLGEVEGTEYKLLLYCRRCRKIWFFHGKDGKIVATKEKMRVRVPESAKNRHQ